LKACVPDDSTGGKKPVVRTANLAVYVPIGRVNGQCRPAADAENGRRASREQRLEILQYFGRNGSGSRRHRRRRILLRGRRRWSDENPEDQKS
jgi:hypothetical protein